MIRKWKNLFDRSLELPPVVARDFEITMEWQAYREAIDCPETTVSELQKLRRRAHDSVKLIQKQKALRGRTLY